jgi:hypothetical protein
MCWMYVCVKLCWYTLLFEFAVHVTVHRVKYLILNPTRCTNISNLSLKWNSACVGQFLCPSSGVFYCTHSNGICHTGLWNSLRASCFTNLYGFIIRNIVLYCTLWCKTSSNTKRHSWNKMFLFITGCVRPASRSVLHAIYLDRTSST